MKKFWLGLYNALVYFVAFGIRVISLFSSKYRNWLHVRKNWRQKLKAKIGDDLNWIWFHASSAGEFEDGAEVLKRYRELHPHYKVLVTFFSSSGYEMHNNTPLADAVAYLPLDTRKNARDFYHIVNPIEVFFSRNDIWPNFVETLWRQDRSPYLLSFLCTPNSAFFGFPQRNLYKNTFKRFEAIGAQNEETVQLLEDHFNVHSCFEAGNTRTARIISRAKKEFHDEMLELFSNDHFTITIGSALKKDVDFILQCASQIRIPGLRWIIVPHDPEELTLNSCVSAHHAEHILWSSKSTITNQHRFLWLDTVGILPETYKYSRLAWIGGGFDKIGIHNITEAIARNNYVAFGPNHRNYPEAIRALNLGFAICTAETHALIRWIADIADRKVTATPSVNKADEKAVEFHLNLMKREAGLE